MIQSNIDKLERIKKKWNCRAKRFDKFYKTFRGAIENYVDWELLQKYLPREKNIKILDAAGGTGRIALPLAKMGYFVVLCDISSKMLDNAKKKMLKEGLKDNLEIIECNICNLHFNDDSYDFVLCWDGMINKLSLNELIRVTKKGGIVSIYVDNKWSIAVNDFYEDPDFALILIESQSDYIKGQERKYRAFSPKEARSLFEAMGIKVLDIYAVCHWTRILGIPKKILNSHSWNENFFKQTATMVLKLSEEPSIKGFSRHLVIFGEKI